MCKSSIRQLRVLVLGRATDFKPISDWVADDASVEHVDTIPGALSALQAEDYDLVISPADEFAAAMDTEALSHAGAVLDGVRQGIGIITPAGELNWANPRMLEMPEEVHEHVRRFCQETFSWARARAGEGAGPIPSRRLSFIGTTGKQYEVTATPLTDSHQGITQIVAIVWDATHAKGLHDQIDAIDQAGKELLNLDAEQFSRLDTQERLTLLEQKILRCTRELLHFDNFEIRVLNKKTNRLDLVLASGMPPSLIDVELYAASEGNGICGYVASRGRSYICPDADKDSRFRPAIDHAKSSLTVPLMLQDEVVGVANYESTKLAAFTEDDRQFAEIFGRYVALALHVLELLNTERHTTTGRLGTNVMTEITAPLNDILTDVESLVEDYIGHDDLRHRLRGISENAVKIRETIKEITSARPGLVGARSATPSRRDPDLAGKHILVADDEDIIRETVQDVLRGYGCEVSTATDGAMAIQLVTSHQFDLVLSDIKMPLRSGYEVFAATKDANPDTPVILTTGFGYDPNHSIVRARREGLASVLFKPFKVDQLLAEIRMALKSEKE
ncbi:MAG: response regulator [Planctomycetes bacterium]|nr:response regulator [Planctomycetota bacterium]